MKKFKILSIVSLMSIILTGCTNETINTFSEKTINDMNSSTWIWNVENMNKLETIQNLKKFRVKEVYLNVGWSPEKNEFYFANNPLKYNLFIKELNNSNIKTQALLSNNDWALPENYEDMENQINKVLDFNKKYKNKFSGIHLDIEPYALNGYMDNKKTYFKSYIKNIEKIKRNIDVYNKTYNDNILLSLDVPVWFYLDEFNLDNETMIDELINYCDELVVMNYTINETDFINNGRSFLKITEKYPEKNIKMAIEAQKSTDEEITSISIYNFTLNQFISYLKNSNKEFDNYKTFTGFAFHDYDSFNSFNN